MSLLTSPSAQLAVANRHYRTERVSGPCEASVPAPKARNVKAWGNAPGKLA